MTRQKRCNRSQRGRWDDRFDRICDRQPASGFSQFVLQVPGHSRFAWLGACSPHAWKWNRARGRVIGGAS